MQPGSRHHVRWTSEKIAKRIALVEPLVYRDRRDLPPFQYLALAGPAEDPPLEPPEDGSGGVVIEPNSYWGEPRRDFVLHGNFQVPAGWDPATPVALYLPLGEEGAFSHPEALVYIDGVPVAACDRHHQEIALRKQWRDGKRHSLALHGWTGLGTTPGSHLLMEPCAIVQINQPTRDFLATARVAHETASCLNDDNPAGARLLTALDEAFKVLDTREPFDDRFYASVPHAHAVLREGIERAGPCLDLEVVATGHAHLDVAWLWTLGQSRNKARRTFYTALALMEENPEYHFSQSQPQLYEYVRIDDPDLFEAIKKRVADAHWEPIGGMWLEADCNITGAESLVRQLLLGRTFFKEHFGADAESPVLWLPDVFGYCWALPQLIKQSRLEYFMTIKMGWNQYNRLPYDTFWWQGLDGTRVLTHFSTTPGHGASTYNAMATPKDAIGTWTNFQQKELHQQLLMIYGHGDGGGGPTREMLENIREMEAVPGMPRVKQGSAGEFFRRLDADVGEELPTWNGELYLEYHRGTYTTQSRTKRANRKSEFALHDAEFVSVLAACLDGGYEHPATELSEAVRLICLNQFHDIIPGSGIGEVYAESLAQYDEVRRIVTSVRDRALDTVAKTVGGDVLLVNPTSFVRHDLAWWSGRPAPGEHLETPDGRPVSIQVAANGTWLDAGALAPFSVTPLVVRPGEPRAPAEGTTATEELLENDWLRVEFNRAGDIVGIFDKRCEREVLAGGGPGNEFQAFEDRPLDWDAWDVDIFYDDKLWTSDPATSIEVAESGPLRSTVEIHRRILASDYVQRVSLAHNSARLDFETVIDWRERNILLKVAFPVEVLSPVATYEIQWGNVQRPTHRNTSWDWARFETCAQKWVDLSETGYGVSLLNDCKHGHDVHDNVLRLSLLRSPTMPDPEADRGQHRFVYSLLPHENGLGAATVAAANALNDPILVTEPSHGEPSDGRLARGGSLISVNRSNVVVETVKPAEDGHGMIVRLYESQRRRGRVDLEFGVPLAGVWRTNLLEENTSELDVRGSGVSLELRPYEIATVRVVPA